MDNYLIAGAEALLQVQCRADGAELSLRLQGIASASR